MTTWETIEYWQHLSQNMIVASPFGFWYDPLYRGGCCWCPNEVEEHLNPPFEPLLLHCTAMLPDAIWFPPYAGLPHYTIGWKYFWSQAYLLVFFWPCVKGQLISKCLYEVIVWTKIPTKNLIDSALKVTGQNLSNFLLVFWSKRFFQKDILKLTDL